jgi:histidinol-phosphate aminotransferase
MTFGGPVLYPVPTFSMYGIISRALDEKSMEVPLDKTFDLDAGEFTKVIRKRSPRLIFLSSPNNPTGNCFSEDRIMNIIRQSRGIVVVDEAYQPFSEKKSFVPLIEQYDNLVVLRTLSKIGLAGLRVGFMAAGRAIVDEVNKVRLPFNLNSLSQKVALHALRDKKQMKAEIASIISERKRVFRELKNMGGVEPCPSDANFILFSVDDGDGVYGRLLKKGILIRNMEGLASGYLRVTIGTPRENNAFLKSLKQVL